MLKIINFVKQLNELSVGAYART